MSTTSSLNRQGLMDTVEQLKRTPAGLDSVLKKTLPYGVAYHHAGTLILSASPVKQVHPHQRDFIKEINTLALSLSRHVGSQPVHNQVIYNCIKS